MRKIGMLGLLIALCHFNGFAFEASRAREIINTIAADQYQGRQSGQRGGEDAAYYLAEKLSEYQVYQGGSASYFQEFPLLVTDERGATLTLMDSPLGKVPFLLGADYALVTHSGSGSVMAPVVIVGFGYVRPDKDRDDYTGADVKGKIVVIIRGYPDSPWDFHEDFERRHTLSWAEERGAAAVLWYQDGRVINGAAIPEASYNSKLPMLFIGDRVLNLLFDDTGYTLKTYRDKIKTSPLPLDTGKRLFVRTNVHKSPNHTTRNVLGFIPGSDPAVKDEIIVVGAHMDHIGVNANGVVYNGANDNASGTGIVSELARSLAANPLRRSILICHFAGEELGLLGSEYFATHPSVPLSNVVCMVNLDMAGHGNQKVVMAGGDALGGVWDDYVAGLDSSDRDQLTFGREDGYGASDNLSFQEAGVPAVALWSRGDHIYYHHYSDDPAWISDAVLQTMGDRAENFIHFLGNHAGSLACGDDSLKLMTSFSEVLDFKGFNLDAQGSVPSGLHAMSAVWVAPEPTIIPTEITRRIAEFQYACETHNLTAGELKDALAADQRMKHAAFLAISETALAARRPSDVGMLMRQGVKVIQLSHGGDAKAKSAPLDVLDEARNNGALALVPLDYNAPARVARWKKQAMVVASLAEFAASPESVRQGLLNSDAMLVLEVTAIPTREQLETIMPWRQRRIHLNAGTAPLDSRLAEQQATIRAMYAAGMSRHDIILLTGGNLRRYFDM
jgi:hypothetical protein